MLWTVFLLAAAAGLLVVVLFAVRTGARLRGFGAELELARAELEPRVDALRAATERARNTPGAEAARPGRTIIGAGGAAQRG
ncbi:hypothetical protein [Actinorugispora endophytica]|uniref:Uncharacterized protein n=1 Tax=Actinorugispora endophytica TaxID=1605990 RepID=A0A4R6UHA5_9ACTN|nr:hypothetical protein [Actinorugispora endophytica]TDQ45732.1 hypothetical protein EV190_12915 [Actinorugispora endophytica]